MKTAKELIRALAPIIGGIVVTAIVLFHEGLADLITGTPEEWYDNECDECEINEEVAE